MKPIFTALGLVLMPVSLLFGTPDRSVEIVEDFLGSNETGFAILRSEYDNLGSYYASRVRRYLDEYEKTPKDSGRVLAIAKRVKSVLLLDTKDFHDQGQSSETVLAQDNGIAYAELLRKYPARGKAWPREKLAKLAHGRNQGVYAGRYHVVSHWELATELFGFAKDDHDCVLEQVMEDMNCLYLRVSTSEGEDEGDRQNRWICNVPAKTEQIHAHLALEPLCLAAGRHPTVEAAVQHAQGILKQAAEEKYPMFELHVWSVISDSGPPLFMVMLPGALESMHTEKFERLKKLMGADLAPMSTERCQERTLVRPRAP
jgi:hypothetical protein